MKVIALLVEAVLTNPGSSVVSPVWRVNDEMSTLDRPSTAGTTGNSADVAPYVKVTLSDPPASLTNTAYGHRRATGVAANSGGSQLEIVAKRSAAASTRSSVAVKATRTCRRPASP